MKISYYYAYDGQPPQSLVDKCSKSYADKKEPFELSMDELQAVIREKAVMLMPGDDGFTFYTDSHKWRFRQH